MAEYFSASPGSLQGEVGSGVTDELRDGWVAGEAALELVLVRAYDLIVRIKGISAYPSAFDFEMQIFSRPGKTLDPESFFPPKGSRRRHRTIPDTVMRFAVETADGQKFVALPEVVGAVGDSWGPIYFLSGGTYGVYGELRYCVPVLPAAGPLRFVCEWPARGVPLSRVSLDAAVVRDASLRAEPLWVE
jgi:hypothetical protein